jgi:hypothetical protein
MNAALFALWAIAGWCGNEPPWWWWWIRRHLPPPPPPPPDGDPWWRSKLIGVVAGIIGGWVSTQVFGPSALMTPSQLAQPQPLR